MNLYLVKIKTVNHTKQNNPHIICNAVKYYGLSDEIMFFEWIKMIECIEKTDVKDDELYIYLKSARLTTNELYEIIYLFKRYKIDMKKLRPLLTAKNRVFFEQYKDAYWYKPLFGNNEKKQKKND